MMLRKIRTLHCWRAWAGLLLLVSTTGCAQRPTASDPLLTLSREHEGEARTLSAGMLSVKFKGGYSGPPVMFFAWIEAWQDGVKLNSPVKGFPIADQHGDIPELRPLGTIDDLTASIPLAAAWADRKIIWASLTCRGAEWGHVSHPLKWSEIDTSRSLPETQSPSRVEVKELERTVVLMRADYLRPPAEKDRSGRDILFWPTPEDRPKAGYVLLLNVRLEPLPAEVDTSQPDWWRSIRSTSWWRDSADMPEPQWRRSK